MEASMLDIIGSIDGMTTIAIVLYAVTQALPWTLPQRLGLVAGAGAWVGLASARAAAGALAVTPGQPVPVLGLLFAGPLLLAGGAWATSPNFRTALLGIPTRLLIGLNSLRVLGVLFLILAVQGRLSGPFPILAGWGDIITGAVAVQLAVLAGRTPGPSARTVAAWNLFGAADLILATVLGIGSAGGGPLNLIHAGVGSAAMQHLPFSLVPTVLVPFYLISHFIIAAQLASRRRPVALAV
jgi:hypothetical protein